VGRSDWSLNRSGTGRHFLEQIVERQAREMLEEETASVGANKPLTVEDLRHEARGNPDGPTKTILGDVKSRELSLDSWLDPETVE
jgi:hypothetical protein